MTEFSFLLFNRMTALCAEYYLQDMRQEVLQMHDFQLLNPYCRVKGWSALDLHHICLSNSFKATFCCFFPQTMSIKHFLLSHLHGSSFSGAPGVFLVVQCFEKGRNNNEENRIKCCSKKEKVMCELLGIIVMSEHEFPGLQSLFPVSPVITFIPSFPGIPLTLHKKNNRNVQEKEKWSHLIILKLPCPPMVTNLQIWLT